MIRAEILYIAPYVVSLALSLGVMFYAWQKRSAPGAIAYAGYLCGQSLWTCGYIFEILSVGINGKIFWDGFQLLARLLSVIAIPAFIVQYTEYKISKPRLWFRLSLVAPAVFAVLLVTDGLHHQIFVNPRANVEVAFANLEYDSTPVIYGYLLYSYAVLVWGFFFLARHIRQSKGLFRSQTEVFALGFLLPILGALLAVLKIESLPARDATPFFITLANLIVGWGVLRLRIFEILPVARDKVFEAMIDPVVILDNQNLIMDINSSMVKLLGKSANNVVGKPAKEVFEKFAIPIRQYMQTSYARAETSFIHKGKEVHYEMTVWPMYNAHKQIEGRIFISHDITPLKKMEQDLRDLNNDLERRVRARTQDLTDAYDATLEGWARALDLRDKETEEHTRRVTDLTLKIAQKMGITNEEEIEQIRRGAILHDIGKMGIPDSILLKPDKLTDEERAVIQGHPEMAYKLLSPITYLQKAMDIPYCHHEKWNGSGYPRGLKGEEIPVSARIFAVADVWDAITSERPYKKAWTREAAVAHIVEQSGTHFDPRVVNKFLGMLEKGEI